LSEIDSRKLSLPSGKQSKGKIDEKITPGRLPKVHRWSGLSPTAKRFSPILHHLNPADLTGSKEFPFGLVK
jgi:hypothetical protein